ncbi:MAG: UDP-N-acetylglucosamine 2-epimerase (hydrolyzing) [Candidatus Scalindua sp.]|jgi:UDP-N-acetylglucosamine 2-epimerase (hydrolysing)|nr:UDP-N-acetylglucosamine 2-epimerase (hydrolyzing) [Candidatus Scalindua sp.]
MAKNKKIIFLSGTRADYGKLKPLIKVASDNPSYDVHVFVTGMHMLEKYGATAREILKEVWNVYLYNNQAFSSHMEIVLSNTIFGFSHYVKEIKPDLIIIHGDRVEALAGAVVGSFNNIIVAHIEGGELSGTIDELIRHSVTKLVHIHFVANEEAKKRLVQMGEVESSIHIIGSPDIDIMFSDTLPSFEEVFKYYEINFSRYAILIYHPVSTEKDKIERHIKALVDAVIETNFNYIVVFPNNDPGSEIIFEEYKRFQGLSNFKVYPSIRFERFLVLLKNCTFIIGNSSVGIREAPIYSVPTINVGNRQNNRFSHESIFSVEEDKDEILKSIKKIVENSYSFSPSYFFGDGNCIPKFVEVLKNKGFWETRTQKQFVDR